MGMQQFGEGCVEGDTEEDAALIDGENGGARTSAGCEGASGVFRHSFKVVILVLFWKKS